MKILHYSDANSKEFASLYDQCDILFTTGDLTHFELNHLDHVAQKKPAFGVYGNHDSGLYMDELGIMNMHNNIYEYQGMKIGGFQGCLKYKTSSLMYTEEEAKYFSENFPKVDVLLLHAGGKDLLDDPTDNVHVGSIYIRNYILEKQPRYVFVGHQYSNDEMRVNNITIYRTFGARIIEL